MLIKKGVAGSIRDARALFSRLLHTNREKAVDCSVVSGPPVAWTSAYRSHKERLITEALDDRALLASFASRAPLPPGYGVGVDERCVEYPWLIARLTAEPGRYLDAGSTHNYAFLLNHSVFKEKSLHIVTLHPEARCYWQKGISYIFSDIRNLPIRSDHYDTIACVSTLEHVGMDNSGYTGGKAMGEYDRRGFGLAIRELSRVLMPGKLFVTVPFGCRMEIESTLVFDTELLNELIAASGLPLVEETYYRYHATGWQLADASACADAEYVNWVMMPVADRSEMFPLQADHAAAARAVACLCFKKALSD